MPKGKESQTRNRKVFNKINLNLGDLKSSIKKMADYANSNSSGADSFRDGTEVVVIQPNNGVTPMDQDNNTANTSTAAQPTTSAPPAPPIKIPSFKKKVFKSIKSFLNKIFTNNKVSKTK